jgi:hypothetical protein
MVRYLRSISSTISLRCLSMRVVSSSISHTSLRVSNIWKSTRRAPNCNQSTSRWISAASFCMVCTFSTKSAMAFSHFLLKSNMANAFHFSSLQPASRILPNDSILPRNTSFSTNVNRSRADW